MKKRVCPRSYTNSISGRKEYIWLYVMITLIAAAILAFGFFLAARQHFSAMELSFRNSAMRQQLSDLEAEQRRLLLVREVARSPAEIKRAAARLGFRRAVPAIELAADRKTAANSGTSVIAKTAMTRPVVISDSMRSAKSKTVKAQTSSGAGEVTAGNPAGRSTLETVYRRPRIAGSDRLATIR